MAHVAGGSGSPLLLFCVRSAIIHAQRDTVIDSEVEFGEEGTTYAARLPTYLLDCAHRLLAWNALIPSLLGVPPDDPHLLQLRDQSIIEAWFDTHSCLGSRIRAAQQFYPQLGIWQGFLPGTAI